MSELDVAVGVDVGGTTTRAVLFDAGRTPLASACAPTPQGADEIIERMVQGIPGAQSGFTLLFSAAPFPGHQSMLEWRRSDMGGDWYYSADLGIEGWLCPALLRYFEAAPERIYAQFKPKGA